MKSLWNDKDAKSLGQDPLGLRVYTSRLLGRDMSLVMHGGGNTSVKARVRDFFGIDQDVLYIKGSGWDLATIEAKGFAAVKMDGLLRQYVSQVQITAGIGIDRPLVGNWDWFTTAAYKYESKQYTQLDDLRYIPARNSLSLRGGVKEGGLRVTVFAQNALNDLTPVALSAGQGITRYTTALQTPTASLPDQRRIGITVDYAF